jgi:hypothetical protein
VCVSESFLFPDDIFRALILAQAQECRVSHLAAGRLAESGLEHLLQ